jgi:hypothetical protein
MSDLNYSLQQPGKWLDRMTLKKRREMYGLFLQAFPPNEQQTIVDVGVTADESAVSSNYFEHYYPYKNKITALSDQPAVFLEQLYPGLTFKLGDARQLPFADRSIDIVFSSAVIEHVGSLAEQRQMLAECYRVATRGVFITTPNRWHPIELHTMLPLLHWLPKKIHRQLLALMGMRLYAEESHLNLLDRGTLIQCCNELQIKEFILRPVYTLGFVSNWILVIRKC